MNRARLLAVLLATTATLVVGPAGAQATGAADGTDLASVVTADTLLSAPLTCGGVTVYTLEDTATFCTAAFELAMPTNPTACNTPVAGVVKLQQDLVCTETDGLIVAGDNTIIDLNGHRIICRGASYKASCQGTPGGGLLDPDPEVGVDTGGFDNVHIYSNEPAAGAEPPKGTIEGFDNGIVVRSDSDNVKIKQLTITGPPGTAGNNPRPVSHGILISGVDCDGGNIKVGTSPSTGNDVSNHTEGIALENSSCVFVGYNAVYSNNSDPLVCHGILLVNSPNNHLRSNFVTDNGENLAGDGGLTLQGVGSTLNLLNENIVNENNGDGISMRFGAAANHIVNNQMLFNRFLDAASSNRGGGVNDWNFNNRCLTQSTPDPPPGVCSPDDVPPPQ